MDHLGAAPPDPTGRLMQNWYKFARAVPAENLVTAAALVLPSPLRFLARLQTAPTKDPRPPTVPLWSRLHNLASLGPRVFHA